MTESGHSERPAGPADGSKRSPAARTGVRVMRIIARLNVGGPARHVVLLEHGLRQRGYESLLLTGPVGWDEGDMSYLARRLSVEPVLLRSLRRTPTPLHDLRALWDVYRMIRRFQPHIVHTHTAKAGGIGRLAAAIAGVPIRVHTFHGHVLHGYFPRIVSRSFVWAERLLARLSDRIVTISQRQRSEIVDTYGIAPPGKVVVVPLGVDLERLQVDPAKVRARRAELGIPVDAPVVGWAGRLVPVKDPDLLVAVAAATLERSPETHFIVLGDGRLRDPLTRAVEAAGITRQVRVLGWQEDLATHYGLMDLLLNTSKNEGTPLAAIEAMAAGVPVIATAVGGVPDIVEDGVTGLLLESRDASQIANRLCCLLENSEQRQKMSSCAQARARRYSSRALVDNMDQLYRQLLADKHLPGVAQWIDVGSPRDSVPECGSRPPEATEAPRGPDTTR